MKKVFLQILNSVGENENEKKNNLYNYGMHSCCGMGRILFWRQRIFDYSQFGTIRHHYTDIVGVASGIYFVSGQRRRKVTENYKKRL